MEELVNKVNLLSQYNTCLEKELSTLKRELKSVENHHEVIDEFENMKAQL